MAIFVAFGGVVVLAIIGYIIASRDTAAEKANKSAKSVTP